MFTSVLTCLQVLHSTGRTAKVSLLTAISNSCQPPRHINKFGDNLQLLPTPQPHCSTPKGRPLTGTSSRRWAGCRHKRQTWVEEKAKCEACYYCSNGILLSLQCAVKKFWWHVLTHGLCHIQHIASICFFVKRREGKGGSHSNHFVSPHGEH